MTAVSVDRPPPTLATLLKRLADYGITVSDMTSTDDVALLIKHHALEYVVCAGGMVNGKWRCLRFNDYYRELFGRELNGRLVKRKRSA